MIIVIHFLTYFCYLFLADSLLKPTKLTELSLTKNDQDGEGSQQYHQDLPPVPERHLALSDQLEKANPPPPLSTPISTGMSRAVHSYLQSLCSAI